VAPLELLRIGREELRGYGIERRDVAIEDVQRAADGFTVRLATGESVPALTVLLATGVADHLPEVPGLDECYGISVHHCPYCDGWEHRDTTIAVIGDGTSPASLALSLKTWSDRVIACTHGRRVTPRQRARLAAQHIELYTERIARIEHNAGHVRAIVFAGSGASAGPLRGTRPPVGRDPRSGPGDRDPRSGPGDRDPRSGPGERRIACEAIFFTAPQSQQCQLAERLGCEFTSKGTVRTDHLGKTCVDGIYVVGDASRDVQFVIVAAAEGAKAAVAINQALQVRAGLAPERQA
jgi:thioredoxin reductase